MRFTPATLGKTGRGCRPFPGNRSPSFAPDARRITLDSLGAETTGVNPSEEASGSPEDGRGAHPRYVRGSSSKRSSGCPVLRRAQPVTVTYQNTLRVARGPSAARHAASRPLGRSRAEPRRKRGQHRLEQGEDPVADTATRLANVLDHLVAEGRVNPGRIAIIGTSRGGFMAPAGASR